MHKTYTAFTIALLFASRLVMAVDLYPLPSDYTIKDSTETVKKEEKSTFAAEAAPKTGVSYEKLRSLESNGYGRSEILIICLISKKSGSDFDKIVEERNKGTRLRKIAEGHKLSYHDVYVEARHLKQEIESIVYSQ